jgi:uncharacterized protein (TIGR03083 family)
MSGSDQAAAYQDVRLRITDLVVRHSDRLEETVPACPGWTARQLVAHLVGLARDLVDGNVDGWATDRWTAAHVARFASRSGADLVAAWSDLAEGVGAAADFGDVPAVAFAFGDAVVHEADLRAVLEPGSRVPEDSVIVALSAGIARWRSVLSSAALPALRLDVPGARSWWFGDRSDVRAVVVEAPAYEAFRALYGRRSEAQVASWHWSGPSGPYLAAGLPFPFRWADAALVD